MDKKWLPLVLIAAFITIALLWFFGCKVTYTNQEIGLRNQATAQQQANQVRFDNTWKIIQSQAEVTDKYKDSFKDVYVELMSSRYKNGEAQLAKLVSEANPNFDPALYSQLNDTIRSERLSFEQSQRQLLSIKQQHDNLRAQWPASLFVGNVPPIDINLVTSDKTNDAFQTKRENDVSVFGGK